MKLMISEGNSKIGAVPNISLPPGLSCAPCVPCFGDGCYAMKAYRMYPNVRTAWDGNLALWRGDPEAFSYELWAWLQSNHPRLFRWHVGGDIVDQAYADDVLGFAELFPTTKFLCFTKRYDLDFSEKPDNLTIVISVWPGLAFPEEKFEDFPKAFLAEDPRAPLHKIHLRCPGHCGQCDYKCWDALQPGMSVIFSKH